MKKRRFFWSSAWLGLILGLIFGSMYAEQNHLCKVFHHGLKKKQHISPDTSILEKGKVVFYFSKDPQIRLVQDKNLNAHKKQMTFMFPMTEVKGKECMQMLQSLGFIDNGFYSVVIDPSKTVSDGLQLSITYDPEKVEMTYDTFDSIGLYKGLVFTFYDKLLLEKMKKHGQSLIRMAAVDKKPNVIIDCGHGGSDTGSIGCGNLQEKDVTLQVGLQVAKLLKNKGVNTLLTRDSDVFVSLDKRTCRLNIHPSNSIFVSIHANSSDNKKASGIETFCLSPPLLKQNFKTMADYSAKIVEYISYEQYKKSLNLAQSVQHNLVVTTSKKNSHLNDRHVKHAVSQVLLGTVVPSILVELGFVSNEREAELLRDADYQLALATGILLGVLDYFNRIKILS